MFIKRGGPNDGKIMSVIEEEELTDVQKKAAKDLSKKIIKSNNNVDDSLVKKSES